MKQTFQINHLGQKHVYDAGNVGNQFRPYKLHFTITTPDMNGSNMYMCFQSPYRHTDQRFSLSIFLILIDKKCYIDIEQL